MREESEDKYRAVQAWNQDQETYRMTVDSSGRIVIPAEAREHHHIQVGDVVLGFDGPGGLVIRSVDEVLALSHAYFQSIASPGELLSDEINADRRSESERD